MKKRIRFGTLLGALLLAGAAACGGSSSDTTGVTTYTGFVFVPPEGCSGCRAGNAEVTAAILCETGPESLDLQTTITTTDEGVYQIEVHDDQLNCTDGSNAGASKTIIITPNVGTATIGGAIHSAVGQASSKDFNGPTQVGCIAAARLSGTTGCGNAAIDPGLLTVERIENLEVAGEIAQDILDYTNGAEVNGAACAAISCTNDGAVAPTAECICGALDASIVVIDGQERCAR